MAFADFHFPGMTCDQKYVGQVTTATVARTGLSITPNFGSENLLKWLVETCERPRSHRAAEQRDERASLHVSPLSPGRHTTTRLLENAVVHHSKIDCRMTGMGQNRQCSGRAQDFRFVPKTRHLRVNEYAPWARLH
jgi:hypothetical protein